MKCRKCGCENAENAKFCAKCGGAMSAKKRGRAWLIAGIAALAAVLVVGGVLLSVNMLKSPYDEQIELGYQLIDDGKYEEAVLAFDRAIEIDKKKPRGYVGKASAMASFDEPDVDAIEQVLILGYEESGSDEVLDAFDEIAEKLTDKIAEEKVESFRAAKLEAENPPPTLDIENDRFGYIDADGNTVIEHKYDLAYDFENGYAIVFNDGKYGIIDTDGREVVACKYDGIERHGELAQVHVDYRYGYVNMNGEEIVPCVYDWTGGYYEGRIAVQESGKIGFLDGNGNKVVPCKYDYADSFSEGLAAVRLNDKWGFIDKAGNEVIPLKYDRANSFSDGLACVEVGDYSNRRYGFVDKDGNEVVPCKYDNAYDFCEGRAAVCRGEKWGYIDTDGSEIIPCVYTEANRFSEGLARVTKGDYENGKVGFIDKDGNEVIPFVYDYFYGTIFVDDFCDGLAGVHKDGKFGIIDKSGNEVIPVEYGAYEETKNGLINMSDLNSENRILLNKNGNQVFSYNGTLLSSTNGHNSELGFLNGVDSGFWVAFDDDEDRYKLIVINSKGVRESDWREIDWSAYGL